jgi:hypothetical protein
VKLTTKPGGQLGRTDVTVKQDKKRTEHTLFAGPEARWERFDPLDKPYETGRKARRKDACAGTEPTHLGRLSKVIARHHSRKRQREQKHENRSVAHCDLAARR